MDEFFNAPPSLHTWDGGKTWNTGGFSGAALRQIHACTANLGASPLRIIETGAGNSTIAFLLAKPTELTSIAPSDELFGRIKSYCDSVDIDTAALRTINNISEVALPQLAAQEIAAERWYDVALIDGGHGWPTVFIDFCYMNAVVKVGGIIIIDDVQLYSVKELARFLTEDPKFELVETILKGKTLVFRKKTSLRFLPDFGAQPYILRKSKESPTSAL